MRRWAETISRGEQRTGRQTGSGSLQLPAQHNLIPLTDGEAVLPSSLHTALWLPCRVKPSGQENWTGVATAVLLVLVAPRGNCSSGQVVLLTSTRTRLL